MFLLAFFLDKTTQTDIVHPGPSWEVGKPATPAFARYKDAYEHSIKLLGYVADDIVSI